MKKIKTILSLIILFGALSFSCEDLIEESESTEGNIKGTVVLSETDITIEEVQIECNGVQVISGSLGDFSFENIAEGTYTVNVYHPKYESLTVEVEVIGGETVELRLELVLRESLLNITSNDFVIIGEDTTTTIFLDSSETQSSFNIHNEGGEVLSWTISSSENWVSFNKISGTDDFEILFEVDKSNISQAYDTATIIVTDIKNGSESISLIVKKQLPQLEIASNDFNDDDILDFGLELTNGLSFDIYNAGGNYDMEWSISKDKDWLQFDNNYTGLNDETIALSIDRNFMDISYDTATIVITHLETMLTKTVTIAAEKAIPILAISSDNFTITDQDTLIDFGFSSTNKSFSIHNAGNGVLNWEISSTADWLTISDKNGSGSKNINLTVQRDAMIYPYLSTAITIRDTDKGKEKTVKVILEKDFSSNMVAGVLSFSEELAYLYTSSTDEATTNDIHFSDDFFYVASKNGSKIVQYDHQFHHTQTFNQSFTGEAYSMTNIGKDLYYSDSQNNAIYKITNESTLNTSAYINLPNSPRGMCTDNEQNIWVCYGNASIRKFNGSNTQLLDFTIDDIATTGQVVDIEVIEERIYVLSNQYIYEVNTTGTILNSIQLSNNSAYADKYLTSDKNNYLYVSRNYAKVDVDGEIFKVDKELNDKTLIVNKQIAYSPASPHGYGGIAMFNGLLFINQESYNLLEAYK